MRLYPDRTLNESTSFGFYKKTVGRLYSGSVTKIILSKGPYTFSLGFFSNVHRRKKKKENCSIHQRCILCRFYRDEYRSWKLCANANSLYDSFTVIAR